jgi:hypothetical protein
MSQISHEKKRSQPQNTPQVVSGTEVLTIKNQNEITIPGLSAYLGKYSPRALLLPVRVNEPRIIIVSSGRIRLVKRAHPEPNAERFKITSSSDNLIFPEGPILKALTEISEDERVTVVGIGEYWELWNGAAFGEWQRSIDPETACAAILDGI